LEPTPDVARGVEATHPGEALEIDAEVVVRLIAQRTRTRRALKEELALAKL